jgi:carbon monoxide dehydrogenase subunit G
LRLSEEFTIEGSPETVWAFLEQPEFVASCMPGMEAVEVLDADNVRVRMSQRLGPMSATFEAKVKVLERVENESIRFEAVGKSVRGAVGSVRALNSVTLRPVDEGTSVVFEGDVVLAGALGSVGQKVIARQASKVTEQFVENLRAGMSGEPVRAATSATAPSHALSRGRPSADFGESVAVSGEAPLRTSPAQFEAMFRWCRVSAAMSVLSVVLSFVVLLRFRRGSR